MLFPLESSRDTASYNQQWRGSQILIPGSIFLVVCTLCLVARIVSARMKKRTLDASDYLLLWSYILNVAQTVIVFYAVCDEGYGRHKSTLSKHQIMRFEKVYFACSLLQPCLLTSSKISVLLLLHRIFITRPFRITAITLMVIVFGWWISCTLAGSLICQPVSSFWNPDTPGHCGDSYVFDLVIPLPWIVTDFAILIAPLPMVRKLHNPLRQRIILSCLFLVGGLTCIISCVRYRYSFWTVTDATWDTISLFICQLAEANSTVMCASLIASKPVVVFLIPDTFFAKVKSYLSAQSSSYPRNSDHHRRLGSSEQLYQQSYPMHDRPQSNALDGGMHLTTVASEGWTKT